MVNSGTKLTKPLEQRFRLIALCLAMGMGEEEAAAHCHVTTDRVRAYMRDPRFEPWLERFNGEIEGRVIERVTRRKIRAMAKFQVAAEEAADKVVSLMRSSMSDSVSLNAATKILKQVNIDIDKPIGEAELPDPEEELRRKNPDFFSLDSEARKELGDGTSS